MKAIHEAPTPKGKTELQAFSGMLELYGIFLKFKSDVLEPLHQLLRNNRVWRWTTKHDRAYTVAKELFKKMY